MITTYFQNVIMGNLFKTQTTPSLPESFYIGLSTSAPSVDGVCNGEPDVNGTGYSRMELTGLSVPIDGVINNETVIEFPESISDWGVVSHYVIFDSAANGNLLFFGELTTPKAVESDTVVVLRKNTLTVQLSNAT